MTITTEIGSLAAAIVALVSLLLTKWHRDKRRIRIHVVTPREHRSDQPREAKKDYVIAGISGTASGPFGAAYLVLHPEGGHPRIAARLDVVNEFWKATVTIPTWMKATKFEVYAFAVRARAEFPLGGASLPPDREESNRVDVRLKVKES